MKFISLTFFKKKITVDEKKVDKVGVDEMGVDDMGNRQR